MRAVLKYNQNDVDLQLPETVELGVQKENEISTNPGGSFAQSTEEQGSGMCSNRTKIIIGWLPNYGASVYRFTSPVCSLEEINDGTSTRRAVMHILENKNKADPNDELVDTTNDITSTSDSVSPSSQQVNVLGGPHTTDSVRSIENDTQNEEPNLNIPLITSGTDTLHSILSGNEAECGQNLDNENSDGCAPLKTSYIVIRKHILEWH